MGRHHLAASRLALSWRLLSLVLCVVGLASAASTNRPGHHQVELPSLLASPITHPLPSYSASPRAPPPPRYTANWTSLDSRPIPGWFQEAKFGIFIHWGVYSVPGYRADDATGGAEWYWNNLEKRSPGTVAFHDRVYGPDFTYAEFAPHFTAELFNATAWANLFRRAGARYVIPTSKHHDGYTLWSSNQAWQWNSVQVGPHRDLLADIMQATRAVGLHAGLYYSLFEWFNPLYLTNVSLYVDQVMYPQLIDLVTTFAPDVLWSDGDWEQGPTVWRSQEFLAWAFNEAPSKDALIVNDRWGQGTGRTHGSIYSPEHSTDVVHDHPWELCTTIDVVSWGVNRAATAADYLDTATLLRMLVRTVSNGGNLLLDVGPNADGTIPGIMEQRLLEMGAWLEVNGEAIYSTRMYSQQQEGPDIDNTTVRYTQSGDHSSIYAHILTWPSDCQLLLTAPTARVGSIQAVQMLGVEGQLKFEENWSGIRVSLPLVLPGQAMAAFPLWVLKLTGFQ